MKFSSECEVYVLHKQVADFSEPADLWKTVEHRLQELRKSNRPHQVCTLGADDYTTLITIQIGTKAMPPQHQDC